MEFDPEKINAVFFDLDDTLIDTAGQLISPALADAAHRMIAAGLRAEAAPVVEFLEERVAEGRGEDYFAAAADHFEVAAENRDEIVGVGRRAYLAREVPPINPLPGTRALLSSLGEGRRLFLVTAGDPATQRAKINRLSLSDAFDAIRWVDSVAGQRKLPAFRQLLEDHQLDPGRCACIGDRVAGEILDANQLGMWTIRLRRGEFVAMEPSSPGETPDFTVDSLSELAELFGIALTMEVDT